MSNPEPAATSRANLVYLAVQLVEKRVSFLLDQWRSQAISIWAHGNLNACSGDMSALFGFDQANGTSAERLTISDGVQGYYYVYLNENSPFPHGKTPPAGAV